MNISVFNYKLNLYIPAGVQFLLCPGTVIPVSKATDTNGYFVSNDKFNVFWSDEKLSLRAFIIVYRLPE